MTAQAHIEEPTSAMFEHLTDYGWVRLDERDVKHWAEDNRLLCGLKPGPELRDVLSQEPLGWNEQIGACKKCVSELVRRKFNLPFRVGQRVISHACGMTLRGKIERFFLFDDNTPALDITREWARPPEEISTRGYDVFEHDTHPGDWYRAAHECKPLEDKPMTQTATKSKKASAAPTAEVPMDKATFDAMAAKTRQKMQGSRPKALGKKAATATDKLATPLAAPASIEVEADPLFPVSEAELEAALKDAATGGYTPRPGDDVRVQSGRPDVAVVTNLKDEQAQVLYGDGSHPWVPITALVKAHTAEQPESQEVAPVNEGEPTPVPVSPGTLGLYSVPLSQLVRSGCNVRHHYDPAAIEELAASLRAEGQIENATGRWNTTGQIEIVAGESRRRAQVLREESGETALTLLVNIRELSDAEALAISATENMRRRSMTGLEECEAMLRLTEAGRTVEELAAMFGYKSLQPVADRILVAKNLETTPRDLLDKGELSLAKAFVIARAPGQSMQLSLTQRATDTHNPSSARALAESLTRGQFLVDTAQFNVPKSGLKIVSDLFGMFEPYFEDKSAALAAQIEHANVVAERRRKKGDRAFVAVETGESNYFSRYDFKKYEHAFEDEADAGTVLYVSTSSGKLIEEKLVKLKQTAVAPTTNGAGSVREMPESVHEAAHVNRARALRHKLLGNSHRTLVLTIHALIVKVSEGTGRAAVYPTEVWQGQAITPETVALIRSWQASLGAALGATPPALVNQHGEVLNSEAQGLQLYDHLCTLDTPELLNLLNVLVAARLYEPRYDVKKAPAALYSRLAQEVDANAYLAETFTLTDEWLKRYPRQELVALAEEAGLGRALVEDAKTLKEMRGRILEHAERLHAEGFVPRLVRFPEGGQQ